MQTTKFTKRTKKTARRRPCHSREGGNPSRIERSCTPAPDQVEGRLCAGVAHRASYASCASCSPWFGVRRGLTLVELMTAMLASSVMFLAVTGILAGNHKQWNQTYDRVNGEVVSDAYVTRRTFDRIVRQASAYWCDPMYLVGPSMTLQLYTNIQNLGTTPALNRYARFSLSGTDLILEQGSLTGLGALAVAGTSDSTQVLAHHVTIAKFWRSGPCVHMALLIDDGHTRMPVTMTATRYNP